MNWDSVDSAAALTNAVNGWLSREGAAISVRGFASAMVRQPNA